MEIKFKQYYQRSDGVFKRTDCRAQSTETINDFFYNCKKVHNVVHCQYSGLKDKNNKEIYDGDIIFLFGVEKPLQVVFENGAFGYRGSIHNSFEPFAGNPNLDFKNLDIEVIGNIFENKELLCQQ